MKNEKNMNIYEVNIGGEKHWICAHTPIQALKVYEQTTGIGLSDFDDNDDIIEVAESRWDDIVIQFPDDYDMEPISFRDFVKTKPEYFCSTVY